MRPVVWSNAAQRDVARIYRYLAQFNPAAAQRVIGDLHGAVSLLGPHAFAGKAIASGRRELVTGDYVITYRVHARETRILRVWHGAQDRPR